MTVESLNQIVVNRSEKSQLLSTKAQREALQPAVNALQGVVENMSSSPADIIASTDLLIEQLKELKNNVSAPSYN